MGLAVVFCLIALLGLKPWEPEESVPRLEPPALEIGVGESVPLPTVSPAVAVVQAAVAPGRAALVDSASARPQGHQGGQGGGDATPAVSVGRAVAVAAPATPSPAPGPAPPSPAPEAQPVAPAGPEVASAPVPTPTPEPGSQGGPVRAGTPGSPEGESCEGDEYVLTITFPDDEEAATGPFAETSDESPVKIVLQRIAADGSVDELELEGDLGDARSLVLELTSEGACVQIVLSPPEDDGAAEEESGSVPAPIAP
jgi:hypothetical protein